MNVKNSILVLIALLAIVVLTPDANALREGEIIYCGEGLGLGNSCGDDRVPFADGQGTWCVFWDRTANGPDESDELVQVGDSLGYATFDCQTFNGEAFCGVAGYFGSDPNFNIPNGPELPDQPVYFIRASGANSCWISDTFRLNEGYNPVYFDADDWTCEPSSCGIGAAPDPAESVEVTIDESCLKVDFTFAHSGENVTGFKIYVRTSDEDPWEFRRTLGAEVRGSGEDVCADGPVQIGVEAINADQTAAMAVGVGRTYLRHFAATGVTLLGGRDIELHLERPVGGGACGSYVWFDFYSGDNFVERILAVTDIDEAFNLNFQCQIPAVVPDPSCYIVMLDTCVQQITLMYCGMSDTTDVFTVGANDQPVIAREFALDQNYPNPFNPTTTIEYTVPNDGQVELSIFNLSGQRIATLFSGNATAGAHRVNWDGSAIATGMYFYRLQMGNQVLTRKMLLMK